MNNRSGPGSPGGGRGQGDNNSGASWWSIGLGVAAGAAALAGGIYLLSQQEESPQLSQPQTSDSDDESSEHDPVSMEPVNDSVSRQAVPPEPQVSNLNSLLNDIHLRYIAIDKDQFCLNYEVFIEVFRRLHKFMKKVDLYYGRYSSRLQFRPEEFNMHIVIGLPVSISENHWISEESDIVIEPSHANFILLRAGVQYRNIPIRDGNESCINKQAYLWLDDEKKFILRSKFIQWFQSVVTRALNMFVKREGYPSVILGGVVYKITTSSNFGAYTLWITNSQGFRLDVDLVPSLKFPESRWLGRYKKYRDIPPGCNVDYWMVVPTPNKFGATSYDANRLWKLDMYDQEKKFIHNSFHLRQAFRLLKKFCHAQRMDLLDDYCIKTLFLWKNTEVNNVSYWQRDVAAIFKDMLREFYKALADRKINYFWRANKNLIEHLPDDMLKGYANNVAKLIAELEDETKNYMCIAKYLLTATENSQYEILFNRHTYSY